MDFTYKFYAIEGVQAKKKFYIAMVPLNLIAKLLVTETENVLPEFRAQRKINETRIPEIKNYILANRDNYVFSALAASIDGNFDFTVLSGKAGILEIDMSATLLLNDGQHRKAAIVEALNEDPSLGEETISVVFFEDGGLKRSQQMFTDLNKHAVKTSNSISTLYDSRDDIAVMTKKLIESNEFLNRYTDKERDILGKNSSKLFTLTTIYKANKKILKGNSLNDDSFIFLNKYWNTVIKYIDEWNELLHKEITKKDLKENYIVTLAVVIIGIGKLGNIFYLNNSLDMDLYLKNLRNVDWSRNAQCWMGNVLRENGKVNNSENTSNEICDVIAKIIGLY